MLVLSGFNNLVCFCMETENHERCNQQMLKFTAKEKKMENGKSTQQESRDEGQTSLPAKSGFFNFLGRNKKVIIVCLAVLLLFNLAGRSFGFRSAANMAHRGQSFRGHSLFRTENIAPAARNFESLGIVFAESAALGRNGFGLTHNTLMREAAELGADAIINVNISPTSGVFNRTWSGSALAVRFLD